MYYLSSFHCDCVVSNKDRCCSGVEGGWRTFLRRLIVAPSSKNRCICARLHTSGLMGNLPTSKMKDLVRNNRLKNCSITLTDIDNANFIYGTARSNLRGGTTRTKPGKVNNVKIEIPRDFYKLHKFVSLSADVMFCNGIPFLTTVSADINFLTAEFLPTRKAQHLSSTLTKVLNLWSQWICGPCGAHG